MSYLIRCHEFHSNKDNLGRLISPQVSETAVFALGGLGLQSNAGTWPWAASVEGGRGTGTDNQLLEQRSRIILL